MISNQGFKLHPEAARDITDIWEYKRRKIFVPLPVCARTSWIPYASSYPSHIKATNDRILLHVPCDSRPWATISLPMRPMKSPFSSLLYFMGNAIHTSLQPFSVAGSKSLLQSHRDTATLEPR